VTDPVPAEEAIEGGRPSTAGDGVTVFEAPALLRILWADPKNMPEHLALWSLKYFGPRAASAVERLREAHAEEPTEELERQVVVHQTRVCMVEGAFLGGPFILLMPVAFCAAMLAQAQMALEVAALNGYSATDRMRAADLLVLQGAYDSTEGAHAALNKIELDPKHRQGKRIPRGARWSMIKRMAFLLGVLAPVDAPKPSRLVAGLRWMLLGATFLVGLVLPLVWVPYLMLSMRRSSVGMGRRATAFYAARSTGETGVTVTRSQTVSVGISAGLVRMALLVVTPIVIALIALFTNVDVGSGKWLTALFALLLFSALVTVAWLGFRWLRYRRRRAAASDLATMHVREGVG
jgi:hypothetical protein